MSRRRPESVVNRLTGGTQQNVVMAGYVERVVLSFRLGVTGAVVVLAVVLLVSRPALPLPGGHPLDAVRTGWLLIAGAVVVEAGTRLRRRFLARRRAAWLSERSLRRVADDLAEELSFVYGQDERWQQIRDPEPVEVAWRALDGAPEPRCGSPARYLAGTTRQRLVVLGGAGAGKSVLALRLACELLAERGREEEGPVPVLVPLASWNPRRGLFRWMAEQLADEHPGACTPVPGAPAVEIAFALLRTGRVLPVLDGFDELPSGVRRAAMRELTLSLRGGSRFVLTSREPEYREHVPDHSVFVRDEIVLCPLALDAVAAYLNPGGRPGTRWSAVLDRLGDAGDRAPEVLRLRETLRVPLMATLAKAAYSREDADPGTLLEPGRFSSRAEVERHLYDSFLDAVYSPSRDDRAAHGWGSWGPEQARAWAGFLAARMKARHQQDFAWWRLDEEVPALARALAIGPAYLLAVALVMWPDYGRSGLVWWPASDGVPLATAYALLCGIAFLHAWLTAKTDWHLAPCRLAAPTARRARGLWGDRRYRVAALLTVTSWAMAWANAGRTLLAAEVCLVAAVVAALLLRALWQQADPFLARSPAALLRADRRAVLTLGWLVPLRQSPRLPAHLTVLCLPLVFLAGWSLSGGRDVIDATVWAVTGAGTLGSWLLYALAVSAWGRYTVARLYLAAAGRLPLRFMRFLRDAHLRGVLRQSGGVYRYRHIELRDRLAQAAAQEAVPDAPGRSGVPGALRDGAGGLLGGALFLGVLLLLGGGLDARGLPGPVRALPAACELLDAREVDQLTDRAARAEVAGLLPEGSEDRLSWADDGCAVEEQLPFSRDVRIEVRTGLYRPDRRSGADRAARTLRERYDDREDKAERLHGLGDEARMVVRGTGLPRSFANVTVATRVANALITVTYAEEFAGRDRATAVARVLARTALRRAGLGGAVEPGGPSTVADVPRGPVPEDTRFDTYIHRPYRPLHGAVWRRDESSHIVEVPGHPLAFRLPRSLECAYGRGPEDDRVEQHWTCGDGEYPDPSGGGSRVRIDVWSRYCGARTTCAPEEARAFFGKVTAGEPVPWREHWRGSAAYAVEHLDGERRRYRMSLKRHWGFEGVDGKRHAFLLWARVEVPRQDAASAQKVVNDLFAQTCAFSSARPRCTPP